jgi:uncharacterized protein (TIGR04141 family)
MKLNIFSVPSANVSAMKDKFDSVGLKAIYNGSESPWKTTIYFTEGEEPNPIPWVGTFAEFFGDEQFLNLIYFGAYVFEQENRCFVLTYGKTHFYVRPFSDNDFGIEVAKRIANENDIKQKATKKFAGKRKREIRSHTSNTQLDIESGESVDYLRAAIAEHAQKGFGRTGKFGSSVLLNAPIGKEEIGDLLTDLATTLGEPPAFALPRTAVIADEVQVTQYDDLLLDSIVADDDHPEFTHSSHEIVGVDFVFSGNEQFTLKCRGHSAQELGDEELDLAALRSYIKSEHIAREEIFDIRIKVDNEGQKSYSKSLKDALEFIVDGENVMLAQGKWLRFNEDYIDQLNTYVDGIDIEDTEPEFEAVSTIEGDFNDSGEVKGLGYAKADKDFSKIRTRIPTLIEAWDLRKDATVFAVKFGTAQELSYVCDQAIAVLEVIRNNANVKQLDPGWRAYCLWLGFKLVKVPVRISESKSIILKQKIEAWARRCRELGIEPRLKFSRRQ